MSDAMLPARPYLIRALYEWIADNKQTPYIVVDTSLPGVVVPQEYVHDNRIILNIASEVVFNLCIGNDAFEFKARFAGISRNLWIPVVAVIAIYAKESNRGMIFSNENSGTSPLDSETIQPEKVKPKMTLIQGGLD